MLHSFLVCDVVEMRAILRYRRPLIGLATGLVVGLDYLNSATVNFAESAVRSGMGADANTYLWLLSSYAGAGVLGIALQERLSRQMRYRTLLLGGAGLFVLGSLLASLTSSFTALIIARIIQGFGGGPLLTCGRVMLQMNIHAKKRPKQLQGFMLGLFLLSAPGPWLSALIMQQGDWHSLFALHVIAGVIVSVIAWLIIPKGMHYPRGTTHQDIGTLLLLCGGFFLWTHTIEDLHYQVFDSKSLLLVIAALGLFAAIVWRIHKHPDPIFQPTILYNRRYLAGLTFYTLYYLISSALSLLLPMYLLAGESLNQQSAGDLTSLGLVCTVLALPLYFRFAKHLPDRRFVMAFGFLLLAGLSVVLSFSATGNNTYSRLLPLMMLKGLFPLLVVIQVAGLAFREFVATDFAHAYALKNVLRLLASTLGAGFADIYWQDAMAESRNALIGHINQPLDMTFNTPQILTELGQAINQQAALLSASQGFLIIAVCAVFASSAVLIQKTLR